MLAGVYALFTLLPPFSGFSYGPIQIRISEMFTVLPYLFPWAKWALYVGCILANLGSPFFLWDITIGAFATLLSGYLTEKMWSPYLAPLPPVVVNALIVSSYVSFLTSLAYPVVFAQILVGQLISCYALGLPLLLYLIKNPYLKERIGGD
ncbi:MAG TPA: QueT transporter family protein [Firmicutes bacterium]|nr:QueT transporter family protein [Candidatus Fermentithermobacillaceae bacterium]